MPLLNVTEQEMQSVLDMRSQEPVDDIDIAVEEIIKEVSKNDLETRVKRLEEGLGEIKETADKINDMYGVLTKKEEMYLKILKEVHELRVHVDKLTPKVNIWYKGVLFGLGGLTFIVLPELYAVISKFLPNMLP